MKKRFLVALITQANDYQAEEARAVETIAPRLGVDVRVIYAENDAINQSQQLLKVIQGPVAERPDAIIVEPVGTGLVQVARAAVTAGIGWAILNREVDYVPELRRLAKVPVFAVASDNEEIGRIQGRQFGALLKKSGSVLYLEGPATGSTAPLRTLGMNTAKPSYIDVKSLKGTWTEVSGYNAVRAWLRISTSKSLNVGVIGCQNDAMALGARTAFEELTDGEERKRWLQLPFTGCDGVPSTGQNAVREGKLAATVIVPPNTDIALEMMMMALTNRSWPQENTLVTPKSFPSIDRLGVSKTDPHASSESNN